jgi:hypothetical protein
MRIPLINQLLCFILWCLQDKRQKTRAVTDLDVVAKDELGEEQGVACAAEPSKGGREAPVMGNKKRRSRAKEQQQQQAETGFEVDWIIDTKASERCSGHLLLLEVGLIRA